MPLLGAPGRFTGEARARGMAEKVARASAQEAPGLGKALAGALGSLGKDGGLFMGTAERLSIGTEN